jgi:hypothetical protein
MTKASLDTVKLGDSLGSGASGEVFAVEGGDFPLVVKRFNSLVKKRFLFSEFVWECNFFVNIQRKITQIV